MKRMSAVPRTASLVSAIVVLASGLWACSNETRSANTTEHGLDGVLGTQMSLAEARTLAAFQINLPGYVPSGETLPKAVYATEWLPRERVQVALEYSDGTRIAFVPREEAPDYAREVRVTGNGARRGTLGDAPIFLLDPGSVRGADGVSRPFRGLLRWFRSGVEILIHADHSTAELLRIARSM